ncbi:MAG: ABC transporter ATP-binding protein [Balneolales bacterium]|nr:ABC transporter ATP-binding protein [Balneolales bacterium]
MNELLTATNLTKRFKPEEHPVVDKVCFGVKEQEIFAILGPSGCGKTTTLRIIAGFERTDDGSIQLNSKTLECPYTHIPPEKRGIGFVFQDYALFPHLSVLENVKFGIRNAGGSEREFRALKMLDLIGMKSLRSRKPHELSGGQQQRVALARALAPKPSLLLMDEPFSNLDAVLRNSTRNEVRKILKDAKMSAILVTHDQEEALSVADRIGVMNNGKIVQIGTPEDVYYRPKTRFVAQFLGKTNFFAAQATGLEARSEIGYLMLDKPARGDVMISIRPEHLTLERATPANCSGTCGIISSKEFKGHDITYHIKLPTGECIVHTDNRMPFGIGENVVVRPLEPAVVLKQDS